MPWQKKHEDEHEVFGGLSAFINALFLIALGLGIVFMLIAMIIGFDVNGLIQIRGKKLAEFFPMGTATSLAGGFIGLDLLRRIHVLSKRLEPMLEEYRDSRKARVAEMSQKALPEGVTEVPCKIFPASRGLHDIVKELICSDDYIIKSTEIICYGTNSFGEVLENRQVMSSAGNISVVLAGASFTSDSSDSALIADLQERLVNKGLNVHRSRCRMTLRCARILGKRKRERGNPRVLLVGIQNYQIEKGSRGYKVRVPYLIAGEYVDVDGRHLDKCFEAEWRRLCG